VQIS